MIRNKQPQAIVRRRRGIRRSVRRGVAMMRW